MEHPFRVIKRQFGFVKVRFRGMKKNTAQLETLFTLSNLWMARKKLMALDGSVRLQTVIGFEMGQKRRETLESRANSAVKLESLKQTR